MLILRTIRRGFSAISVIAAMACFVAVAEETKEPSVSEKIDVLTTAHQDKVDAFYKEYRAASTDEERQKIAAHFPTAGEFVEPLMALVADDLKSVDAATVAKWVLRNDRNEPSEAVVKILEAQSMSEDFSDLALGCLYVNSDGIFALLEKVIKENPSNKAKAAAAFARSNSMSPTAAPDEATTLKRRQYLDIAVAHGTEVMLGKRSIANRAASTIFEMENLQIGMTAPEVKGEDIDGVEFALSEYRGKVVVIDFWGDW